MTCYLLTPHTWVLKSLGDAPHIDKAFDGLQMLRVYNQDAGEVRIRAFYNLAKPLLAN
jgi:hypothetical protein